MNRVTLYKNAKHGISRFSIWHEGNTIYWTTESKIGDSPMKFSELVPEGLASRTIDQQIELRMNARIRGKRDNGYVDTMEQAQDPNLKNTMGHYQPMLAQKLQDVRNFNLENYYAQPKLDGHRCLITRDGSEIIAYSRRGRPIHTIDHIIKDPKFANSIPDGTTLDGELYAHGYPLQTIASWAKRLQPNSAKLRYVIYDVIEPDTIYEERLSIIFDDFKLPFEYQNKAYFALETMDMSSMDLTLKEAFTRARDQKYEGLILRDKKYSYEIGRRSKGLIKVKETHDDEFEVVNVTPSKWNWGVLHCILPSGKTFKVAAPGTIIEKTHVLNNKEQFIGNHVTVEYAHLTKDGVPFHPVALSWRLDL